MPKTTDSTITWWGSGQNKKQVNLGLGGALLANKGGMVFLEAINSSGAATGGVYLFSDGTVPRYSATYPTSTNAGTAFAAGVTTLDGAFDGGKFINASAATGAANAFSVGGAADDDKIELYHDGSKGVINCRADDMMINAVGGDVYTTGDFGIMADNKKLELGTDGSTDSYLQFNATDLEVVSAAAIRFLTAGDADDYMTVTTAAHVPTIGTTGTCDLAITSSSGEITFADDNLTTLGTLDAGVATLATTSKIGNLTFANGSITDSGGAISFGDEALTTTGTINLASDNVNLTIGASGVSDARIYFDGGGNLMFWDSATNASWSLQALVSGTPLNPVVIGDLTVPEGLFQCVNTSDELSHIKRNNATGSGPVFEVEESNAAGGVAFLVDSNHTGAADAMQITYDGTDNGLNIVGTATAGTAISVAGPAAQTDSLIKVDGTTGAGWDGASTVGMVNIASDGAHADVAASNLNITTGTSAMIAAARGSGLRVIDTQTLGADGFAAYISSLYNDGLKIDTGSTVGINMELQGVDAQVAPMLYMDGTTTDGWDGAASTGMLHVLGKGAHANAAASLVYITEATGASIGSGRGTCLGIVDATTVGTDSWVGYLKTTANDGLLIETAHVDCKNLWLKNSTAGVAANLHVDGTTGSWVGTSDVGLVDIDGAGILVAGASLLRVNSTGANTAESFAVEIETTGAYTNSTNGAALKVLHSGTAASGTVYAVAIDSANDQALHVIRGLSVFDETVTCTGGVSIEDSASGVLTLGAANELTIQNDGTTSKIIVATDALTVGASATNYTQFSTAGLQTMAGSAQPTQNIYIPAQSFSLLTGSGTLAIPTGCKYSGWNMDPASDESYSTTFYVPEDWNAAAVTATIYWCTSDTNETDVIFNVNTSPFAENEDTAVGHTNTDSVTDTACSATAYDLNVTAATAIAANTEWAAGDLIVLNINRDADNTLDTNAADAFLIGVKITYSADHI